MYTHCCKGIQVIQVSFILFFLRFKISKEKRNPIFIAILEVKSEPDDVPGIIKEKDEEIAGLHDKLK